MNLIYIIIIIWSSVRYKVAWWSIMFICGMLLRCAGTLNSVLTVWISYSRSDNHWRIWL